MAFEKFRRVQPVDDRLLDLIYNLALDFERKRQFNKAESAYQYIAGFNKAFRDVPQKLSRAKKLSETVVQIGRAHVLTPVTNAHRVCRHLLDKNNNHYLVTTTPQSKYTHLAHQLL